MTRLVIVSDTHCREWEEVHPDIRKAVSEADIAVHCGDFTGMGVVEGMKASAKRVVLVHGNSDPVEIRQALPYVEVIEVKGKRIGVIHPAWGGPEFGLEELLPDFGELPDAILFGHLHEPIVKKLNTTLFVNPGQGYASFMVSATIAVVEIDEEGVSARIVTIQSDAQQ